MILILCLKSINGVQTSIEVDYFEQHEIKLHFFTILGKMTPGNDPGDPLVGVLKIQKPVKYDLEVLISHRKLIKSVWVQIWGDQGGHFCKNHVFYRFPIHLYRGLSQNQTQCFLGVFASRYDAENRYLVSPYYLESLCKRAKKRYFIFFKVTRTRHLCI